MASFGTLCRLTIDIRHLVLSRAGWSSRKPVVGMSKHLCGVATDLSLRCLHSYATETQIGGEKEGGEEEGAVIKEERGEGGQTREGRERKEREG